MQFKERNEEAKQRKEQLALQEREEEAKERTKTGKGRHSCFLSMCFDTRLNSSACSGLGPHPDPDH